MLRFVLLSSLVLGVYQTAAAGIVRISSDNTCAAFAQAVSRAAVEPTSIMLSRGDANYISSDSGTRNLGMPVYGCDVNLTGGNLTIEGNGATIHARQVCGVNPAFSVGAGAVLTIRNLKLMDETDACTGAVPTSRFLNSGTLILENVTVVGNSRDSTLQSYAPATATLRNTTWIGAALRGSFDAYNSTFVESSLTIGPCGMSATLCNGIRLSNSILSSTQPICPINGSLINSLGGNVAKDSSCGLSNAAGDKIDANLSLPTAADHGGLVPTVQIGYASPAYRAGVAQYCEATDARGVVRNATNCDAGAYELGGGPGLVTSNGMNGLYYVPGIANGHYVSLQRIHDNNDVMVFWNTFDNNGNQAWIYGVGTLTSDRHIHAQMVRNTGGVLQPGAAPTGAKASPWGTVDIDLTSCAAAQFSYQSNLHEFGSGQFPLSRLAFESAIDCGD